MAQISRRRFLTLGASLGFAAAAGGFPAVARSTASSRVAVVGGGFGGATAAKYLRLLDPRIEVTLIEKKAEFVSCPGSNEVLSGERSLEELTFRYESLRDRYGIRVIQDEVVSIDTETHILTTAAGGEVAYDRAIVSPGIGFVQDALEGYDAGAAETMPHAWTGGQQTLLLREQLMQMEDGGTVAIVVPPKPFRCPAAPYERASQIAHYLSNEKPESTVVILDSNDAFSLQDLFQDAWEEYYPDMIRWIPAAEDGRVERVDVHTRTLFTVFEEHQADVVNLIPAQQAGHIAQRSGLTDHSGWCPVNHQTFESTLAPDIHVIGDACAAGAMPKAAYAANSQAKVCARAVAALLNGSRPEQPVFVSTCYGLIAPEYGISFAAVYRLENGEILSVEEAGGGSPARVNELDRELEARYARGWFAAITADTFS